MTLLAARQLPSGSGRGRERDRVREILSLAMAGRHCLVLCRRCRRDSTVLTFN